jgi:hypothetical protein
MYCEWEICGFEAGEIFLWEFEGLLGLQGDCRLLVSFEYLLKEFFRNEIRVYVWC